jgi:hypothetical protein
MYGGDHTAGRDASLLDTAIDAARVRAMYTHPDNVRRDVGRLVLGWCERAAAAEGFTRLELVATLAGRPLYERYGFRESAPLVDRSSGVAIPSARMVKDIERGRPDSTFERYWSLFAAPSEELPGRAADCIAHDAVFESSRLDAPIEGPTRSSSGSARSPIARRAAWSGAPHRTGAVAAPDGAGRRRGWRWRGPGRGHGRRHLHRRRPDRPPHRVRGLPPGPTLRADRARASARRRSSGRASHNRR